MVAMAVAAVELAVVLAVSLAVVTLRPLWCWARACACAPSRNQAAPEALAEKSEQPAPARIPQHCFPMSFFQLGKELFEKSDIVSLHVALNVRDQYNPGVVFRERRPILRECILIG